MAIGARAGEIAWAITTDSFIVLCIGAVVGGALGVASTRYIESLYGVKANDLSQLVFPSTAIFAVALLAALPAVIRAVHIDPVAMLRSE